MIGTSKNFDVICLQMRNFLPRLESDMQIELKKLLNEIGTRLVSAQIAKPEIDILLKPVFNFRVKAIKWLLNEEVVDILSKIDEIYLQIEKLRQNPKLEIITENILFAVRCNQRVINSLVDRGALSTENLSIHLAQLPTITYDQFLATLAYSIPDDEAAQKMVDWVNASLYIETIILAASIIDDERLNVSDKIINELSFLIADAAQYYSALASELGFSTTLPQKMISSSFVFQQDFLNEQKYFSDLGISDFAENF